MSKQNEKNLFCCASKAVQINENAYKKERIIKTNSVLDSDSLILLLIRVVDEECGFFRLSLFLIGKVKQVLNLF